MIQLSAVRVMLYAGRAVYHGPLRAAEGRETMRAYERLLAYARIKTPSDENVAETPSTACQFALARHLEREMKDLGLAEVYMDEHAYVYGKLPPTPGYEEVLPIGFIAHIDTVPVPEDREVRPCVVENYDGGELPLGNSGMVLSPDAFPHLPQLAGETLIVTDGATVLGADDKAGVAEIMTAMEELLRAGGPHGPVSLCFTPDEEIGHGASLLDLDRFGARYAYTVDGGDVNEVEYETFNAAAARWTVQGTEVHPGSAKGVMVNASLIAAEIINAFPPEETPAHTEGYEGFYHLCSVTGDVGKAELSYIIRDHDRARFAARKQFMEEVRCRINAAYGGGVARVEIRDQYYNMAEKLRDCPDALRRAERAIRRAGMTPVSNPVRGGTDGAQLSFRGLPCPNLGTGGFCFHGPYEHITAERMDRAVRVIREIVTDCGDA